MVERRVGGGCGFHGAAGPEAEEGPQRTAAKDTVSTEENRETLIWVISLIFHMEAAKYLESVRTGWRWRFWMWCCGWGGGWYNCGASELTGRRGAL
jgi:hypothetical protein